MFSLKNDTTFKRGKRNKAKKVIHFWENMEKWKIAKEKKVKTYVKKDSEENRIWKRNGERNKGRKQKKRRKRRNDDEQKKRRTVSSTCPSPRPSLFLPPTPSKWRRECWREVLTFFFYFWKWVVFLCFMIHIMHLSTWPLKKKNNLYMSWFLCIRTGEEVGRCLSHVTVKSIKHSDPQFS